MLCHRIIACLDVARGRVVKGTQFVALREIGDPAELARAYEVQGADEIIFLDIGASAEDRATTLEVVQRAAEGLFVPLTVGGGVRTVDDVARTLRAGADKVSLNSAAVARPAVLSEAAERFGAQCVVASIDAKREGSGYRVHTHGGRTATERDAVEWAAECERLGAGEILLTSIDRDGARAGFDLELTRRVVDAVSIPVIASGGAGAPADVAAALREGGADAALVAGILHDGLTTVGAIKTLLQSRGIAVRSAA